LRPIRALDEVTKDMARETIMLSLADLERSCRHGWEYHRKRQEAKHNEILNWFNIRSQAPFGYGWCLEQSGMNPNDIRLGINRLIKGEKLHIPKIDQR
jgi:hypothetical protein